MGLFSFIDRPGIIRLFLLYVIAINPNFPLFTPYPVHAMGSQPGLTA